MATIKCATGKDFDRMNDMCAYSHLQDCVGYAKDIVSGKNFDRFYTKQIAKRSISSRSHFIFNVW